MEEASGHIIIAERLEEEDGKFWQIDAAIDTNIGSRRRSFDISTERRVAGPGSTRAAVSEWENPNVARHHLFEPLVSNERIPLTPSMRMVFEIDSLSNATPATVSRAGILYINEDDIVRIYDDYGR